MNQHFIPKFLIEGFVDSRPNGNRGVWVYRAATKTWSKRSTRKTAALDDFYSFVEANGERDDTLEQMMQSIETPMARILRKEILNRRSLAPPRPYDLFVTFCALLICRNPATVARVQEILAREAKKLMTDVVASKEKFHEFRKEFKEETGKDFPNLVEPEKAMAALKVTATKAGGLGFSIAMLEILAEALGKMAVDFVFSPEGKPFITSDLPYTTSPSPRGGDRFNQVIVPLSAEVVAVFNESEKPVYEYVDTSPSGVFALNQTMLSVAREYVISSRNDAVPDDLLRAWANAPPEDRKGTVGGWTPN